mgnify:CR=1 FL=1
MEIKLDGIVSPELREFLLSQEGITDVEIDYDNYFIKLNIKLNEKTTPNIVMKYIELFEKSKYSNLVEFNKDFNNKSKTLKYKIDDMCCEFCYKDLVMELFKNDKIKSVKSNIDFNKPFINIEFTIEYDENYSEDELIRYIKNIYN